MKRPVFKRSSSTESASSSSDAKSEKTAESEATAASPEVQEAAGTPENVDSSEASTAEMEAITDEPTTVAGVDAQYVARLEAEVKDNYDKYLRAVAELENYKKRAIRERADLSKYAGEHLARDLLEISDTFDLALAQNLEGINADFLKGIQLIRDRFVAILEQHSVKGESVLGKPFDPNTQQALASVPTSEHAPNTVIEEYKRAYFFKDKLIRPAQVVVSIAETGNGSGSEGGQSN